MNWNFIFQLQKVILEQHFNFKKVITKTVIKKIVFESS